MRKVAEEIGKAFSANRRLKIKSTECTGNVIYLHGHKILQRDRVNGGYLFTYTLAGYPTVTTRSRLNDLATFLGHDIRFYQHDHEQYVSVNGEDMAINPADTIPYSVPC